MIKAVILLVEVILMEEICWHTTSKIESSGLLKVWTAGQHSIFARAWETEVIYFETQRARTTAQTNGYIGETKKTNLPSRELIYPSLGKGKLSSNMTFDGIC